MASLIYSYSINFIIYPPMMEESLDINYENNDCIIVLLSTTNIIY